MYTATRERGTISVAIESCAYSVDLKFCLCSDLKVACRLFSSGEHEVAISKLQRNCVVGGCTNSWETVNVGTASFWERRRSTVMRLVGSTSAATGTLKHHPLYHQTPCGGRADGVS